MTRPSHRCAFCVLPVEGVKRIRCKRSGVWVWVCATRKHVGVALTPGQRGIVARRMVQIAGGG